MKPEASIRILRGWLLSLVVAGLGFTNTAMAEHDSMGDADLITGIAVGILAGAILVEASEHERPHNWHHRPVHHRPHHHGPHCHHQHSHAYQGYRPAQTHYRVTHSYHYYRTPERREKTVSYHNRRDYF